MTAATYAARYVSVPMSAPVPPAVPDPPPRSPRVVFFTLVALLLVVLGLVLVVFRPFFITLGLATALTLLLKPMHLRLTGWLRGRDWAAALLIVLGLTVVILIPVLAILATIATQALSFYEWVTPRLTTVQLEELWSQNLPSQLEWLKQLPDFAQGRLTDFVTAALSRLAGAANSLIQGAVTGLSAAAFELLLMLIMLYFFLRDGPQFRAQIRRVSPLSKAQADEVLNQAAGTMRGALAALLLVPIIQGVLATLGYGLLGVPNALLWGGITTLIAFVPLIGTPLVWVPICIYLAVQGQIWQCAVLAVYCSIVVSSIDNVLRPWIMRGSTDIHPLWSFLAILGGLISFGALGLLVGPLIVSLGVSALRIYEMDVLRSRPSAVAPASPQPAPVAAPVDQVPT
ncbi:MAG TPA: AI-2E family transporter [Burkholderiales bacterium]|nr:AI-2E family transporter [Burkholderiales bacterium]